MLYELVRSGLQEPDTTYASEMNTMKLQISKLESEKEKLIKSNTSFCMELHNITEQKKSLEVNNVLLQAQV